MKIAILSDSHDHIPMEVERMAVGVHFFPELVKRRLCRDYFLTITN